MVGEWFSSGGWNLKKILEDFNEDKWSTSATARINQIKESEQKVSGLMIENTDLRYKIKQLELLNTLLDSLPNFLLVQYFVLLAS